MPIVNARKVNINSQSENPIANIRENVWTASLDLENAYEILTLWLGSLRDDPEVSKRVAAMMTLLFPVKESLDNALRELEQEVTKNA